MKTKPVKDPSKVIKIEAIELPERYEKGEGEYEVRYGHKPKEREYHDLFSLEKFLNQVWPEKAQQIIDMLQNFRTCYLNLDTQEITS